MGGAEGGPRAWGEVVQLVVAFDVTDPGAEDLEVEAEALVVALRPDGTAGTEQITHRVLGALDDVRDIDRGRADHEVHVPGLNRESEKALVEPLHQ